MDRAFRNLLKEKRNAIVKQWRDIALSVYAPEASKFMTTEEDPFSNPVGHTFARVIEELVDQLIGDPCDEKLDPLVADVMRIRAVQDLSPSKAVGFIFAVKQVLRDILDGPNLQGTLLRDFFELESRIDHMALRTFEAFVVCRERIYEIKANELRRRSERVINKLNERLFARASKSDSSERGGTK